MLDKTRPQTNAFSTEIIWESIQSVPKVQISDSMLLKGWSTETSTKSELETTGRPEELLVKSFRSSENKEIDIINFHLIINHLKSLIKQARINERGIKQATGKIRTQSLKDLVEKSIRKSIELLIEKFDQLVSEVYAPENFENGEKSGQFNLVIVIKQEQYSVIDVIFRLSDLVFGPIFCDLGILFGLIVISEKELEKKMSSNLHKFSDEFGKLILLMRKE